MMMDRIGVFVCHCGINIAGTVDVEKVVQVISGYPGVAYATDYIYMCSDPGQNLVVEKIREEKLQAVVIACCSPTLHQLTFRRTVERTGINPFLCEIANIREQCSWVHKDKEVATEKAIKIIRSIIEKAKLNEELEPVSVPVTRRALVIGGGIAGIQASLDIANSGYEVLLVEKEPSIGGHMIQLSETFPTLDCSQCIMTPKMVEVGQNDKIRLLTYSEIEEISGYVGNFKVKIRRKASFVDWAKCNGCGECPEVCPVNIKSEFDVGLASRKAIYRPFPQAIPNKFTIDKRGTPPCRFACPAGVNVPGYVALASQGKFKEALALELEENPFPSVCGRVCTHPCETECKRGEFDEPLAIRSIKRFIADYVFKNKDERRQAKGEKRNKLSSLVSPLSSLDSKVAIVGSGPSGLSCAYQLAKLGYSTTVFEALPVAGGMLRVGIPEFRLPRDSLQKDIDYIRSWGVEIKTNSLIKAPEKLLKDGYSAVYIATGAHLERKLGIEGEDLAGVHYGIDFLRKVNLNENRLSVSGERLSAKTGNRKPKTEGVSIGEKVAVIGGGNSAIDAARTALRLGAKEVTIVYRRSRVEMPANEEEIGEAEQEKIKIRYLATPTRFIGQGKLQQMECIRMELGAPDASGRRRPVPIKGSEFIIDVDTVIPTIGQTPDTTYLPEDTNLKINEKWHSFIVDGGTLQTSVPGIFAGGDAVSGPATVIEAIANGKEAAFSIDGYIRQVELKERRELKKVEEVEIPTQLPKGKRQEMKTLPVEERISIFKEVSLGLTEEQVREEAARCLACGGCCECGECEKVCEPEAILHTMKDEYIEEEVGAIVVATGYELYPIEEISEYGAGKYKDVINGLQFERLLSASGPTTGEVRRPSDGKIPKTVAFVSCVGSRDPEHHFPYCSKICCMYMAKHAMLYKHRVQDGEAIIFYMDIRTIGKNYEEFVKRAQVEDKVLYIRSRVSRIFKDKDELVLVGVDTLTGERFEIKCDMVVLSMAIVSSQGIQELAKKLRIQIDEYGFLSEAHPKLRPVETLTAGFFLAGAAQAPKDIPNTVAQASGAASKVLEMFSQEELLHGPIVATVDEELCSGCGVCVGLCPYNAREIETRVGEKIARVNEILCEGCGSCISACPSGASQQRNFRDKQICRMVDALLLK